VAHSSPGPFSRIVPNCESLVAVAHGDFLRLEGVLVDHRTAQGLCTCFGGLADLDFEVRVCWLRVMGVGASHLEFPSPYECVCVCFRVTIAFRPLPETRFGSDLGWVPPSIYGKTKRSQTSARFPSQTKVSWIPAGELNVHVLLVCREGTGKSLPGGVGTLFSSERRGSSCVLLV